MEFGKKLKILREQRHMTQKELAKIIYVSRETISKWESGRGLPSKVNEEQLCAFFHVDSRWLVSERDVSRGLSRTMRIIRRYLTWIDLIFLCGTVALLTLRESSALLLALLLGKLVPLPLTGNIACSMAIMPQWGMLSDAVLLGFDLWETALMRVHLLARTERKGQRHLVWKGMVCVFLLGLCALYSALVALLFYPGRRASMHDGAMRTLDASEPLPPLLLPGVEGANEKQ